MTIDQTYIGMLVTHKDSATVYRINRYKRVAGEDRIEVSHKRGESDFVIMSGNYLISNFSPYYDANSFPNQAPM